MHRFLAVILFGFSFQVLAADIPQPLQPWVKWVQYEQEFRTCPFYSHQRSQKKSQHVCAWPGTLDLDINAKSGQFKLDWQVYADSWVPLPGGDNTSIIKLLDNNQPATFRYQQRQTSIYLTKGLHQLQGFFQWHKRPEEIRVPNEIALVNLTVEGQSINFPERELGLIWFGEPRGQEKAQTNHITMQVERLISDNSPMFMKIKVYLDVSGAARDEMLGKVLGPQVELVDIQGDLSTRVDSKGNLWAQLRPGDWELTISLRIKGYPEQFTFEPEGKFWPTEEIWSWQSNDALRITQIQSESPIDSTQLLTDKWGRFAHFLMKKGSTLKIIQRSRGMSQDKDRLNLQRQQWLSFEGDKFIFKDKITGYKTSNWRLDMLPGYHLESARSYANDLLVTAVKKDQTGIELRVPNVNLTTTGEAKVSRSDKVSGWDASFDSVSTDLFIPPGRMLLAAPLADKSSGDWLGYWNLWSLFSVLIVLALISRFISWKVAIPALFTLILGYYEKGMPLALWFNLVIAIIVASKFNEGLMGRIFKSYKVVSALLLIFALFPFLVDQFRSALYPQLERYQTLTNVQNLEQLLDQVKRERADKGKVNRQRLSRKKAEPSKSAIVMGLSSAPQLQESDEEKIVVTGSRIKKSDLMSRYQAGALIQAGEALPNWRWHYASLSWSGPIDAEESSSLIILGRTGRVLWRIGLILASLIWLGLLFEGFRKDDFKLPSIPAKSTTAIFLLGMAGLFSSGFPSVHAADFPNNQQLQQLQKRLYPAKKCEPVCASLIKTEVKAEQNHLRLKLNYHLNANVVVPIPVSKDWKITRIDSDNEKLSGIYRHKGQDWIALDKGIHQVVINAILSAKATISIKFLMPPGYISTQGNGWEFAGITSDKLSGNNLQLIRYIKPETVGTDVETTSSGNAIAVKPFVQVERSLSFDNEWELRTQVNRIAPVKGALNIAIPLWSIEFPFIAQDKIKNKQMQVSLEPGEDNFEWRSKIERNEVFSLKAGDAENYTEVWKLVFSPMWNMQLSGIPMVYPGRRYEEDYWEFLYYPRANEKLDIKITRPEHVVGKTLVIDNLNVDYFPGTRGSEAVLNLAYHATQAQPFPLTFTKTATISEVKLDGKVVNIRADEGTLSLQASAGKHRVQVRWRDENKIQFKTILPQFAVKGDFSNLQSKVTIPGKRWTLFASGPGYGPVVLYWGELLVFILVAIGLARVSFSALNFRQWLLLGLGMSTFSWPALGLASVWLLTVSWRKKHEIHSEKAEIVLQWAFLGLTVTAVLALVAAIPSGLLATPEMGIVGNGSYQHSLNWFLDQGQNEIPQLSFISFPLWVYKALMLLWATWISFSLIKWIGWSWDELKQGQWKLFSGSTPKRKSERKQAKKSGPESSDKKSEEMKHKKPEKKGHYPFD